MGAAAPECGKGVDVDLALGDPDLQTQILRLFDGPDRVGDMPEAVFPVGKDLEADLFQFSGYFVPNFPSRTL